MEIKKYRIEGKEGTLAQAEAYDESGFLVAYLSFDSVCGDYSADGESWPALGFELPSNSQKWLDSGRAFLAKSRTNP